MFHPIRIREESERRGVRFWEMGQFGKTFGRFTSRLCFCLSSGQLHSVTIGRSRRISVDVIEEFARNGAVRIAKTITQPSLEDLSGFIEELNAGSTTLESRFAGKLSKGLNVQKRHLSGERFNAEQLRKHRDKAFSLAEEHVAKHDRKKADGQTWTNDEKRVTRFLSAAISSFDLALEEQKAAV